MELEVLGVMSVPTGGWTLREAEGRAFWGSRSRTVESTDRCKWVLIFQIG